MEQLKIVKLVCLGVMSITCLSQLSVCAPLSDKPQLKNNEGGLVDKVRKQSQTFTDRLEGGQLDRIQDLYIETASMEVQYSGLELVHTDIVEHLVTRRSTFGIYYHSVNITEEVVSVETSTVCSTGSWEEGMNGRRVPFDVDSVWVSFFGEMVICYMKITQHTVDETIDVPKTCTCKH